MMALKDIPQQEFQKHSQQWQHHWAVKHTGMLAINSFQELHCHAS